MANHRRRERIWDETLIEERVATIGLTVTLMRGIGIAQMRQRAA